MLCHFARFSSLDYRLQDFKWEMGARRKARGRKTPGTFNPALRDPTSNVQFHCRQDAGAPGVLAGASLKFSCLIPIALPWPCGADASGLNVSHLSQ